VIIYQTMEFGIKDENFLLEVEGNDKYSRVSKKNLFIMQR